VELITSQEEREEVAALNLLAGKRAKASTAYAAAREYLAIGCRLLTEDSWTLRYSFAFELKLQHALCEVLTANFTAAEGLIAEALTRAKTRVDLGAAYWLRVDLHVMRDEHERAIAVALECLRLFGIAMSPHPERAELDAMFEKVWRKVESRSIESLIELPLIDDPEMEAAMNVLSAMFPPALFTDETLTCLHLCYLVDLSLENGTSGASAYAFGLFGIMLGHFFGRYEEGYRFGTLAAHWLSGTVSPHTRQRASTRLRW
jgi:predicted ATPase